MQFSPRSKQTHRSKKYSYERNEHVYIILLIDLNRFGTIMMNGFEICKKKNVFRGCVGDARRGSICIESLDWMMPVTVGRFWNNTNLKEYFSARIRSVTKPAFYRVPNRIQWLYVYIWACDEIYFDALIIISQSIYIWGNIQWLYILYMVLHIFCSDCRVLAGAKVSQNKKTTQPWQAMTILYYMSSRIPPSLSYTFPLFHSNCAINGSMVVNFWCSILYTNGGLLRVGHSLMVHSTTTNCDWDPLIKMHYKRGDVSRFTLLC